ncbi:MAG TPA: HlyD family efflux transporter periplasmic adaptor subunit [Bacteroidia bacterium]|nr:HlyD family efflux transporter periplasmic adaptor subunit [Bacteroidia bacterium]
MKKNLIYILFILVFVSCNHPKNEEEQGIKAKSPVQVVNVRVGSINDNLVLSATTIYLKRNVVTAQIPAFITKVNIRLGDKVSKGAVLYELETKERKALGKAGIEDTSLANLGIIKVYAPASGIISTFDKQQTGDYILEGTQLCTISESNDLAFQVNVPFEFIEFAKVGTQCSVMLPDNSIHQAVITTPLTAMNALAQTQTILAKTNEVLFLPENLIVKVQISKAANGSKQIVPKPCVLSDEMMQEFWVMKVINDSTAIKVPVIIGNKNANEVEIQQPQFNAADKIIINGNYGLPDTASVKITK